MNKSVTDEEVQGSSSLEDSPVGFGIAHELRRYDRFEPLEDAKCI